MIKTLEHDKQRLDKENNDKEESIKELKIEIINLTNKIKNKEDFILKMS